MMPSTARSLILLALVTILLVVSVVGVVYSFHVPVSREKQVDLFTYQIQDYVTQQAYGTPSHWTAQANPTYFPTIIDSVMVHYNYRFLTDKPASRVTEAVEISAVLESKDMWQKEVTLVPRTEYEGNVSIDFPLNYDELEKIVSDVSNEIKVPTLQPILTLKATVDTVAETDGVTLTDEFVQTSNITLGETMLQWDKNLALSQPGYRQGVTYEHQGEFSYAIRLKPNILFGATTLTSPAPPIPVKLPNSQSYAVQSTDRIDVTFSYHLTSKKAMSIANNELGVTALLSLPGVWQETLVLVPQSEKIGDFSITFPLDVSLFYNMIQDAEGNNTEVSANYNLAINIAVHTLAQTDSGPIDEAFTRSINLTLEPDIVDWPTVAPETKDGAVKGTMTATDFMSIMAKVGSLAALGLMGIFLYLAISSYREKRRIRLSPVEAEAMRAKTKHKDIVVDVEGLPGGPPQELVVSVGSLEALARTADLLLKPVLHKAEPNKHVYWVIDGLTRYQYVASEIKKPEA